MAEVKREEVKVRGITDAIKDVGGLVKGNYLAEIKLKISLWEKNLREKVLSNPLIKLVALQGDSINFMRDFLEKFPKVSNEEMKMWNVGLNPFISQTDWFISRQKDYLELVRGMYVR
jgi:hypothetical protein